VTAPAAAAFAAYRLLARAATPVVLGHLDRRLRNGKEHAERWTERVGRPGVVRPPGPLIWLHGASVGEAVSGLPLIERLAGSGATILVTTGTVTSASVMHQRLPEGVLHQFVPVDLPGPVGRFLDHWRPDLALWLESELWPTMLTSLRRRQIPAVLINGRLSPRTVSAWSWAPWAARFMLASFDVVFAQSAADAARFASLGLDGVRHVGNLKFAGAPLECDATALAEISQTIDGRPRWVAASTHAGEEIAIAGVHRRLVDRHPGLVTIIVPRHPERGAAIAAALGELGHEVPLQSRAAKLPSEAGLYVADRLGELGLWFRAADIVFIGNSLAAAGAPGGGHNPLEPARLGAALLFGPAMENFTDIAADLLAVGAARNVLDEADLATALDGLLADPRRRAEMGEQARRYAEGGQKVVEDLLLALAPYLARLRPA
jgi:3-deoxy-D-manno-octulosonic-acid transferase